VIDIDDGGELLIYHGGAKPGDQTFADIVAIDGDIVEIIAERERRRWKRERRSGGIDAQKRR
jgi:hypothetical protein